MTRRYLALDASTYTGTAAILNEDGVVIAESQAAMRGADEERLMPAVVALFESAGLTPSDLAGVVCGEGPGSFTSLRIAASIAKGIASGVNIPLFAVSSLLVIPASASPPLAPGKYIALLDAMRGDFHALNCVVGSDGDIQAAGAVTLQSSSDLARASSGASDGATEIGPGRTIEASPRASGIGKLIARVLASGPVEIDDWEPIYGRLPEAEVRLRAAASSNAVPIQR